MRRPEYFIKKVGILVLMMDLDITSLTSAELKLAYPTPNRRLLEGDHELDLK